MGKPTAEETIHEQDKAKRLLDEKVILEKAYSLTNGEAENPKTLGEVILWQVKQSIDHGTLLRIVIDGQSKYRLETDCIEARKPKTWKVRLFGITYNSPVSVTIIVIGFMAVMYCKKNGWM